MAIQEYVSGEEFKKLIDDKIINANSVKYIIKKRGIFPVCTSPVSYTHLDVYKRQGKENAQNRPLS